MEERMRSLIEGYEKASRKIVKNPTLILEQSRKRLDESGFVNYIGLTPDAVCVLYRTFQDETCEFEIVEPSPDLQGGPFYNFRITKNKLEEVSV